MSQLPENGTRHSLIPRYILHNKFGIPNPKNIGDRYRARKAGRTDVRTDGRRLLQLNTSWVLTVLEKEAKKV